MDNALKGETIGYCETAVLYDEQPEQFMRTVLASAHALVQRFLSDHPEVVGRRLIRWNFPQRLQQFRLLRYGHDRHAGDFRFPRFHGDEHQFPARQSFGFRINPVLIELTSQSLIMSLVNYYITLFVVGLLTMITEWKVIKCPVYKKVLYTFTFPFFLFTYIPISLAALFQKVEWRPIEHRVAKTLDEVR